MKGWLSLFLFIIAFSSPIHAETVAGVASGSGSVNGVGAFTYRIPIKVAPGINNLAPELALNYNSQSPSSASSLGYGWNLSGLSEIHRCGKTIALDAHRDGVKYNEDSDRLCRDGIPLVGTSEDYWKADYYHSSQEDWAKIEPADQCYYGPCYFVVYTKDNRTLEYGRDENARSLSLDQRGVGRWLLNKVTDGNGNEIHFEYKVDGAVSYISRIAYGHEDQKAGAQQSVTFEYADKSEQNQVSGFYSSGNAENRFYV